MSKKKQGTISLNVHKYTNLKYLEKRGENEFKDVKDVVNTFVSSVEKSLEKYKV